MYKGSIFLQPKINSLSLTGNLRQRGKNILTGLFLSFLMLIFFFVGPSFGTGPSVAAHAPENILIVSIDALHPKALGPKSSPHIYKLMEKGVYTLKGQSTDPPLTLISHSAMFSGLSPLENGKTDNDWLPGQDTIQGETIFQRPKRAGFLTGYFYSKEKLGFLINKDIDVHGLSRDFALDRATEFFQSPGKHFCFLHISGLDQTGPTEGWLSPGYLEELFFIDDTLKPLTALIQGKTKYLIIITSDHGDHGKIHGSEHPEDSRLPLVMISDIYKFSAYQDKPYKVNQLKTLLDTLLMK
jgi:predicted AlkP superfamily pyrophosphatase or phosphodiesterase